MSEVRVSVEWLFGEIANCFKFLDVKMNLKIELSSVGKLYMVSGVLRNALTCLCGSQTSQFFWIGSTSHSGLLCMNVKRNIKPLQYNLCKAFQN